ncbi:NAD(P)-dependent oxidoreductase [Aureispira sp. CCB-QB1]|uniref:NAD-dependent epimerase/dehydratase family protein n=1 Tax=Aureispira sp. CCB-QB1 TaxID=1313421 RepID=UPI000698C13A|nr:NAD(P)-dependent oxidoreductase [Aureispira sp. CCB-QB1]
MEKILVTGGAGYIGSVLVRILLKKGYNVRVLDNLMFGGESLIELFNYPEFEFQKGDVRNEQDIRAALEGVDAVVNLAAIVGDPACAKTPDLAKETNLDATQKMYTMCNEMGISRFVFASTCSNYGKMEGGDYVVETSKLAPVSLYAETKVSSEKFLLNQPKENICKPTSLRFSTVYGLSERPRFDLTVNEFTKEIALGRELVIFGEQFWRPYCHVYDLARSVVLVLESDIEKVAYEVFNVGDTTQNYTKKMIVDEIVKQIPTASIKYVQKNEDPRDYRVNFDKIKNQLGFEITIKVPQGVEQIKYVVENGFFDNVDDMKYRNS